MCWGRARRTALATWLFTLPGVATFTRDRQGRYAEGARRAAPEAIQVADRFHLVRNLRQAVERELAVHRRELRVSLSSQTPPRAKPEGENKTHQIRVRSRGIEHRREIVQQHRQEKIELFQKAQQMKAAGMKVTEIARQLGVNRRRLDKWVRLKEFPERSRMQPRPGMVESFREYLRQRWGQGCHHGHELLAEIRQRVTWAVIRGLPSGSRRGVSRGPNRKLLTLVSRRRHHSRR